MPTYHVHRNENYTHLSNVSLRDGRLTLKAKGLLALMMSLPQDWKHSITGFTAICKEGKHSIASAFKELEECGYVIVEKRYPEKGRGRIEYVYHVFEEPVLAQEYSDQKTVAENQSLKTSDRISALENPPQLNKEEETREVEFQFMVDSQVHSSSKTNLQVSGEFTPPTLDDVRDYCRGNTGLEHVDPDLFYATYAAQGWMMGNNVPMMNWQWALKKWASTDRLKAQTERTKQQADANQYAYLDDMWKGEA